MHTHTHIHTHRKGNYDARISKCSPEEPRINKNPIPGMKTLFRMVSQGSPHDSQNNGCHP